MRSRSIPGAAATALVLLLASPAAAAPAAGRLTPLAGPAGCLKAAGPPDGRCATLRSPETYMPFWAFSPDGRQALGWSGSAVVPVLDVDPDTGALTQPAGPSGCLGAGCAQDLGLGRRESVTELAFSPAGDRLYALLFTPRSAGAPRNEYNDARLTAWARDPLTGALEALPGGRGCLAPSERAGCARAPELSDVEDVEGVRLTIAPDGRSLTILGTRLVTVALDSEGGLTAPVSSCHVPATVHGRRAIVPCGPAGDLDLSWWFTSDALVLSPDGTHAYLGILGSWDPSDADTGRTVLYARDPATGALSNPGGAYACAAPTLGSGCLRPDVAAKRTVLDGPQFTSGGAAVVLAAGGRRAVLAGYTADPATGLLRRRSCLSTPRRAGCTPARGLARPDTRGLTLSPDGTSAYVAAGFRYEGDDFRASAPRALTSFRLDPATGRLAQLPGAAGCVSPARRRIAGCARIPDTAGHQPGGSELEGALQAPVLSPDGRSLYVVDTTSIVAFSRDPAGGALTRLPGRAGCVRGARASKTCRHVAGLAWEEDLQVSPDGRFLTFLGNESLVQLRRETG